MLKTFVGDSIGIGEAISISLTGIVVVMIMLAVLAVLVVLLSKGIRLVEKRSKKNTDEKKQNEKKQASEKPVKTLPETDSAGTLELVDTDEKTAAVIMAIVSDESKIPLNRLRFNSIKLIREAEEK